FRGRFADVTADRATTGADLQHPATQERREGTQQVGAARAEVVERGPVMDLARQLGREYGTVLAGLDRTQQRLLDLVAVAVPPGYGRSLAHPQPARVVANVGRRGRILVFHHMTWSSALRSVIPRNVSTGSTHRCTES